MSNQPNLLHSRLPSRRPFVIAVLVSFLFLMGSAWICGGVAATPFDTMDSQGRKMGFNDVFSSEHYSILLRNGNWHEAAAQMEPYDWVLAAAHGLLLIVIFNIPLRYLKFVLWLQPGIFFWGVVGLYALPLAVLDVLFLHSSDREGFVDIAYISIMGQGAWLWACFFMLWKLRGSRRSQPSSEPECQPGSGYPIAAQGPADRAG